MKTLLETVKKNIERIEDELFESYTNDNGRLYSQTPNLWKNQRLYVPKDAFKQASGYIDLVEEKVVVFGRSEDEQALNKAFEYIKSLSNEQAEEKQEEIDLSVVLETIIIKDENVKRSSKKSVQIEVVRKISDNYGSHTERIWVPKSQIDERGRVSKWWMENDRLDDILKVL